MKIRNGFVTNSSSTSFACFGVCKEDINISKQAYLNMFYRYVLDHQESSWFKLKNVDIENMTDEEKINFIRNEISDYELYECGLIEVGGQENDEVGITISSIVRNFPDENIGNIKTIVAEELNKQFGTNFSEKDISYFESGWYDG